MTVNEQPPAPSRPGSRRPAASGQAVAAIPVASIEPNPFQPRTGIGEVQLRELAASMAAEGLVQPITVRPHPTRPGAHQLIAGERRWRAAQLLSWETIAALSREADDVQMRLLAYVENSQRENLTPADEAEAFSQLLAATNWSQAELARRIGKSRPYVIERLQLGEDPDLKHAVHEGLIAFSVARAMRRLIDDPDQRRALLAEARRGGTLSLTTVRARSGARSATPAAASAPGYAGAPPVPATGTASADRSAAGPATGHGLGDGERDGPGPGGGLTGAAGAAPTGEPPPGHTVPTVAEPGAPDAPPTDQTGGTGLGLPGWLHTSPGALPTIDPAVNERMDYFGTDVRALVEQVRELRQRALARYPEIFGADPLPVQRPIRRQFAALAMVLAAEGYALAEAWRQGLADDEAPAEAAH
ncbi:MAG: ParB/RepB/Spo0J family partition protein [Chloroflexi bacterium]|nr:ParB/RepB/Spo0J family partition protein [Chloroflexota bacterium]